MCKNNDKYVSKILNSVVTIIYKVSLVNLINIQLFQYTQLGTKDNYLLIAIELLN